MGLKAKQVSHNAGIHWSNSPFEALSERMNWLEVPMECDPYGKELLDIGLQQDMLQAWLLDGPIAKEADSKPEMVFAALHNLDAAQCSGKLQEFIDGMTNERSAAASMIQSSWRQFNSRKALNQTKADPKPIFTGRSQRKSKAPKLKKKRPSALNKHPKNKGKKVKGQQSVNDRVKNHALVLLQFAAASPECVEHILDMCREWYIHVRSKGSISAEEIRQRRIVDQHFYNEARNATQTNPKDLDVPRLKFQSKFGIPWSQVIKEKNACNVLDAIESLGVPEMELASKWEHAESLGDTIACMDNNSKMSLTIGKIALSQGKFAFICGGEFLVKRCRYTQDGMLHARAVLWCLPVVYSVVVGKRSASLRTVTRLSPRTKKTTQSAPLLLPPMQGVLTSTRCMWCRYYDIFFQPGMGSKCFALEEIQQRIYWTRRLGSNLHQQCHSQPVGRLQSSRRTPCAAQLCARLHIAFSRHVGTYELAGL